MSKKQTVGYIGLGLMGKPMARNLLKAGYPLVVHNRSQEVVEELVSEGAIFAASPKEVAEKADVIFTNLPDSPDVEKIVLGENGILSGVKQGTIVIDNSTIKPETARHIAAELATHNCFFLDAPVSGGDVGAIKGTLTIMIGGDTDALAKVMPMLQVIGTSITHIGDAGAGQIAKCANQIMVAAQMVAMGELLILAKKSGADPVKVVAAIKGGAAQCWALDVKPDNLFAGNRNPGFKSYMMLKDLGIVQETAKTYGVPIPGTATNTEMFQAMQSMGMKDLDNSAVVGVIEVLANTNLLSE
jgi:2-hydroxy-3-oxopropionate reductase